MHRFLSRLLQLALMAAGFAPAAAAEPAKPIEDWANLSRLAVGAEIRVVLTTGRTLRGFLQTVTPESLAINATTSQETLSRPEVRRVSLKKAGHRGRNTLIGLAIGTAGGLASGAVLDSKLNDNWFPNAGKAVFSPVGAILGTVIGVAMPTGGWRDIYRLR